MTGPVCGDPAEEYITAVMAAMRAVFDPDSACPPISKGTTTVHFVPGEGPSWDPLDNDGADCDEPFLWVRLAARYRSSAFPEPTLINPCGGMQVLHLELGVARCVDMSAAIDWKANAEEAEWGLDDSYRLDRVICLLNGMLKNKAMVASEPAIPQGPEGGGIIWSISVYIGINS